MTQFTHKNHYVPQFYLKQWSTDNTKIWEYKLLVSNSRVSIWKSASIEDAIGWRRDLYTGYINDSETDEIEKWYEREIENPAQNVIERVNNREDINKNDIKKLVRFMAAQHLRTPAGYLRGKSIFENTVFKDKTKDLSELTKGAVNYLLEASSTNNYQDFQKWLPLKIVTGDIIESEQKAEVQLTTGFTRNAWIFQNMTLLNFTHNCLYEHDWKILEAAPGVNLYTSDDPAIFMNYNSITNYDFDGGWGKQRGNILFPLSPKFFLFTEIGTDLSNYRLNKNPFLTYMIQRATLENAFLSIYSLNPVGNITCCRKRVVDAEKFKTNEEVWKNWNEMQLRMEKEFKNV